MDGITNEQARARLRIAALRIAQNRWPILVSHQTGKPEPNLIKPKQLVTVQDLEDFYFDALCKKWGV